MNDKNEINTTDILPYIAENQFIPSKKTNSSEI